MIVVDPRTGLYVEIVPLPLAAETKPELKARILGEKLALREAASRARRQQELDAGAL
ncbi:hypothetical protein ACRBEV_08010 [Methylobacterium phyllosphaerae]